MTRFSNDSHFVKISHKQRFDDFDPEEDLDLKRKKQNFRRNPGASEFRCKNCKLMVVRPPSGTVQRNHCPNCLHSLHVDQTPGDRSSECGSVMEPISIWVRKEEWVLLHRCKGCGVIHANRIGPDDNESLLLSLAARAMAKPCVPLYTEEE
ncbi:RNHCP domain-containing protein [Leptospira idonii]|uniref:RNHCP domain-containing protein n=1 Tax=Leptospira idonii TaxID=1193500 RepID=A0A4R9LZU1_9LEPT|nr:RNHCP domain-containing protein [Leptospira idonii]TGN18469.1 RNHCP domain-containing protein [Leptospira idonii]